MSKLEIEILELLKEKYIEINGNVKFNVVMTSKMKDYYLETWMDNILFPMDGNHIKEYSKGSGNELQNKMTALRSSSAMTFNMLGNNSIKIKPGKMLDEGIYSIEYEKKLETLKGSSAKANLDAVLCSADKKSYIFCEMKMMEWLGNSSVKMSSKYFTAKNYKDPSSFQNFEILAKSQFKDNNTNEIKEEFKRYDALQMFKHLLGIYNYFICNGEGNTAKKITLINCVWEVKDTKKLNETFAGNYSKKLIEERYGSEKFKDACLPIIELFKDKQIALEILYVPFDEFIEMFEMEDNKIKKLQRYHI